MDGDRESGWWPEEEEGGESSAGEEGGAPAGETGPEDAPGVPEPTGPPRPPRGLESRDRPKVASRYSLYVGIAFAVLAVVAVFNAVRTEEGGILGAESDENRGLALPEFAAPDVLAPVSGAVDANISQDDCDSERNPCPDDQVRVPACDIDVEDAIRICDFFDKPLAISFWFTRGGDCMPTQDAFDAVASRREAEANFLSVNVLDDREDVAAMVRERGWEVPVAHDADGAVSNIFGVGVCPTIVYAYPGGILHSAEIVGGNLSAAQIDEMIDDLIAKSRERERAIAR